MDFKGRDFLKLLDFTSEEILALIDLAADFKDKKKKGIGEKLGMAALAILVCMNEAIQCILYFLIAMTLLMERIV